MRLLGAAAPNTDDGMIQGIASEPVSAAPDFRNRRRFVAHVDRDTRFVMVLTPYSSLSGTASQ
jgi:hypothetical protein